MPTLLVWEPHFKNPPIETDRKKEEILSVMVLSETIKGGLDVGDSSMSFLEFPSSVAVHTGPKTWILFVFSCGVPYSQTLKMVG